MKLMFAGDIHGNGDHIKWLANKAYRNDVDVIVSCGDFGYWPHYKAGRWFMDQCDAALSDAGVTLYWVDGNHENHDALDALRADHGADLPIPTSDRTNWIPRGCKVEFGELTVMGYGGAWSVDSDEREAGTTWWPQEVIDPDHVASIPEQKVDVLVSHEAPLADDMGILSYKDAYTESVDQRVLITEVVRRVSPDMVVCGHHHLRETFLAAVPGHTVVNVLGRDEMGDESILIVDATKLAVMKLSSVNA